MSICCLLAELGWETVNAYGEFDHGGSMLGRETRAEVILTARLRPALVRLNPEASREAIGQTLEELRGAVEDAPGRGDASALGDRRQ